MVEDAFAEKPEKAPKKPAAKPVEPEVSVADQLVERKRGTKLRKAVEFAIAAKCEATCPEGALKPTVGDLINQAVSKLEAALTLTES